MNGLAMLCCLALTLTGDDALTRAERAYRAGDFRGARDLYIAALHGDDGARGLVLFQLGNCAYRLGERAEAIVCYRRALPHLPRDPELRANLQLVGQQLGVEPPTTTLASSLLAPLDAMRRGELLALATVLQGLGLLGYLLAKSKALRRVMLVVALLGIGGGARLVFRQLWASPAHAIVLDGAGTLHASADATSPAVLTLRPGEALDIDSLATDWVQVRHPLGRGFVERTRVGLVN